MRVRESRDPEDSQNIIRETRSPDMRVLTVDIGVMWSL